MNAGGDSQRQRFHDRRSLRFAIDACPLAVDNFVIVRVVHNSDSDDNTRGRTLRRGVGKLPSFNRRPLFCRRRHLRIVSLATTDVPVDGYDARLMAYHWSLCQCKPVAVLWWRVCMSTSFFLFLFFIGRGCLISPTSSPLCSCSISRPPIEAQQVAVSR